MYTNLIKSGHVYESNQEELSGSGSLLGYRTMWTRLRLTRQLNVRRYDEVLLMLHAIVAKLLVHYLYRDTVMMLLRVLDSQGSNERVKRRLQRRVYRSKVIYYQKLAQ